MSHVLSDMFRQLNTWHFKALGRGIRMLTVSHVVDRATKSIVSVTSLTATPRACLLAQELACPRRRWRASRCRSISREWKAVRTSPADQFFPCSGTPPVTDTIPVSLNSPRLGPSTHCASQYATSTCRQSIIIWNVGQDPSKINPAFTHLTTLQSPQEPLQSATLYTFSAQHSSPQEEVVPVSLRSIGDVSELTLPQQIPNL